MRESQPLKIVLVLFVLSLLGHQQGHAQLAYTPERWFPLDKGSFWHYEWEEFDVVTARVVTSVTRDTLESGRHWFLIEEVYCDAPHCPTALPQWYTFTHDHYLLSAAPQPLIAGADTVLATDEKSVFAISSFPDTLRISGGERYAEVSLIPNPEGSAADSTDRILRVYGTHLFEGMFIYNIGRMEYLIGARVGNRSYGDTRLIETIIASADNPTTFQLRLSVYPNPAPHGNSSIELWANHHATYEIVITDVVGRRYTLHKTWIQAGDRLLLDLGSSISVKSGVYYITVLQNGRVALTQPIVIVH